MESQSMTSDIFLKRDGIEAVTTNEESLEVTTGENKDPDILLSPNSAALTLGGGDGDYSDGDIRLMDRPDNGESKPRIHLTGGKGDTDSDTRIRIDGSDGTAKLGAESADDPDIELVPSKADIELGGGSGGDSASDGGLKLFDGDQRQRVLIESGGSAPRQGTRTENAVYLTAGASGVPRPDGTEGDAGQLFLGQVGDDFADATVMLDGASAQLTLGSDVESGDLLMYRQDLLPTISLSGHNATVLVGNAGGSKGESGTVHLVDENDTRTVSLDSDATNASGGALSVAHDSGPVTVDASGGDGRLSLGNGAAGSDGVAGTLTLENDGGQQTVTVESNRQSGGAGIQLTTDSGDTTADLDAGEREMELGGAGVGGTILLTDGKGTTFELTVQDGTIRLGSADNGDVAMELEPDEGLFKIVDGDDDTGFQVDTQRKTIKKGQKYTSGVVNHGS